MPCVHDVSLLVKCSGCDREIAAAHPTPDARAQKLADLLGELEDFVDTITIGQELDPTPIAGAIKVLQDQATRLLSAETRVKELEESMVGHFQRDHIEGDGPEIDRWRRRVASLEAGLAQAKEALEMVCDWRNSRTLSLGGFARKWGCATDSESKLPEAALEVLRALDLKA